MLTVVLKSRLGRLVLSWIATATLICPIATAKATDIDCLDTESALEYWRPVRQQPQTNEVPADELALVLLPCLGSPNPELRDQIAYELIMTWLRSERLTDKTREKLLADLSGMMTSDSVFNRSFAALVLSEIMRSDANRPFMSNEARQKLLDLTVRSLGHEDDYRGLDADVGWIHPVAHLSDLLWRFTLHPATTPEQMLTILDAVRSKIAPDGIFYTYNESDRLARVVSTVIQKNSIESADIAAWINGFEKPRSMEKWSDAFSSAKGMAELHNTKLFVRALSDQLTDIEVDSKILEMLDTFVEEFTQLI